MKILSPNESAKKLTKKNKNLDYLLKKRFNWMKKYINGKRTVIELGSGNGFIKKYLGEKIITSDLKTHQNIDYKFDIHNYQFFLHHTTFYKIHFDLFPNFVHK